MKKTLTILFIFLASNQVHAQVIKEKAIDVSIGLGMSAPYDEFDVMGSGFYAQGKFVLGLNKMD